MKPGDYVVPTINYAGMVGDKGIYFDPFPPDPNTICTVVGIRKLFHGKGMDVLDVEETHMLTNLPLLRVGFDPAFWRVIEKPEVDIQELLKQTEPEVLKI